MPWKLAEQVGGLVGPTGLVVLDVVVAAGVVVTTFTPMVSCLMESFYTYDICCFLN